MTRFALLSGVSSQMGSVSASSAAFKTAVRPALVATGARGMATTGAPGADATNNKAVPITVARGDGIGPEIMDATLRILEKTGAKLDIEEIVIGEQAYKAGHTSGIAVESFDSLRRTKVFLKAPITTPQGGGFKSLNVTVRKSFGLYANIRPCVAYAPFVRTKHKNMDVVIVRENEEDLYAGIEHQQTDEVVQCLKLITRPGSERIIRYAFEYARANGRKKVTAFTKDNIMKLTDGLFHRIFDEVGAEYPDLEKEHWIVDIGAAKLADTPEAFDVIVLPNLYGDILSDVAAQIAGSVGLAGSSNIGAQIAMFEAIHGSAPRRAGQNLANPSGLILGAVQMLMHIGQANAATVAHNAWLKTMEDGIHTYDIFDAAVSKKKVGTKEFATAVIERMGEMPKVLKPVHYKPSAPIQIKLSTPKATKRTRLGVDVFVGHHMAPNDLAAAILPHVGDAFTLDMLSNRGQKVWPDGSPETFIVDHMRCRFLGKDGREVTGSQVVELQKRLVDAKLDVIKTEGLFAFDGVAGFTKGQGQ